MSTDLPDVQELIDLVAVLLDVESDELDAEMSLRDMGLDSIAIMRVVDRFHGRGFDLPFRDAFNNPSISAWRRLARRESLTQSEERCMAPAPFADLTPVQQAYWIGRRADQTRRSVHGISRRRDGEHLELGCRLEGRMVRGRTPSGRDDPFRRHRSRSRDHVCRQRPAEV